MSRDAAVVGGPVAGAGDSTPQTRLATVATWIVLGVVPVCLFGFYLAASFAHDSIAYDFRKAYLPAAHDVRDGVSPYPGLDDPDLLAETAYVYPPALAYVLTPLTAFSEDAGSVVAAALALALLLGTLLVLRIRDRRCYGALLLWAPSLNAVHTASASVLVAFAAALVWRYRATVSPLGLSLGAAVAVKLVLWPLFVWTLATRRLRATVWAAVVGVGIALGSWALLGFEDLGSYPSLLRRLADLEATSSYSIVGVAAELGLGETAGKVLAACVGLALLAGCAALARRGDDARSFTCAIAAALAFTPVLWEHYLVLLVVPLAVMRPRFSGLWLLPIVIWLAPRSDNGEGLQTVLPLAVAAILVTLLVIGPPRAAPATAAADAARP
jgi:alpha-1,2-mannosyltransferase